MGKIKFCQSCGMPLTDEVLGTNADGSKNEDYCMYCYRDGKFLQECTMEEMIEHCAQFVNEVNKGLPQPITKEEYIGQMKMYFPQLKRWRKELTITGATLENPALAGVKELIAQMADSLPIAFISSVDNEGYPCTKAMLAPQDDAQEVLCRAKRQSRAQVWTAFDFVSSDCSNIFHKQIKRYG